MIPGGDGRSFVGDVYILQDGEIVGLVEAIKFLQWPRIMLNRFFSQPKSLAAPPPALPVPRANGVSRLQAAAPVHTERIVTSSSNTISRNSVIHNPELSNGFPSSGSSSSSGISPVTPDPEPEEAREGKDITVRALNLVAQELAVDIGMLTDVTEIADLGLDSLMSLVLAARLREELGIEIRDAFFLEVSTVGDLKKLLR